MWPREGGLWNSADGVGEVIPIGAQGQSMMEWCIVFDYLLNEGADVWRPVDALALGHHKCVLLRLKDNDDEDKHWESLPGSIVKCEEKTWGRKVAVAVELICP